MKLNYTSINYQPFKNTTLNTWIESEMLLLSWAIMCLKFQTNGPKLPMMYQSTKLQIIPSNMILEKPSNLWSLTVRLEQVMALCFIETEKKPWRLPNSSVYSKTMSTTNLIILNIGITLSTKVHGSKNVTNISNQTVCWRAGKIFSNSLSTLLIINAMRTT